MISELWEANNVNEPTVHQIIKKSFASLPTTGMRLAPEILVLELMREVFFDPHFGDPSTTKELNPDNSDDNYSNNEQATLHALRGRRKNVKSKSQNFFAPAYPGLAKKGWLSAKRERVIINFLLTGPIAQEIWYKGETNQDAKSKQEKIVQIIIKALIGSHSDIKQGYQDTEILAAILGSNAFNFDLELAKEILKKNTYPKEWDTMSGFKDRIAQRITHDFLAICRLEENLPRMQWIQILMTFLRFALPIWLLSQMQIIQLLHQWLMEAMDSSIIPTQEEINKRLNNRYLGLLHPTLTPTRELFEHIEKYMKCRIEVNMLLHVIDEVLIRKFDNKKLKIKSGSASEIGIEELLIMARDAVDNIKSLEYYKEIEDNIDIRKFILRRSEQFAAWRSPLTKGQGKNIDEFFRVLYRAEEGDDSGGYLLSQEGRGIKRGFKIFPGQLLLKTITYLAAQEKQSNDNHGGSGKLILKDVEDHFSSYGVDFSTAANIRPLLMAELQSLGLLIGSPDAGASVAVFCPYSK